MSGGRSPRVGIGVGDRQCTEARRSPWHPSHDGMQLRDALDEQSPTMSALWNIFVL
ncbi:protein of unknown function [Burkholderia multivorans]